MPSPVGHLLAGTAVYFAGSEPAARSRVLLAVSLLGSIAPDFDFIPGILIGDMRAFHHGASHSFAFAALFGLGTFLIVSTFDRRLATRAAVLGALTYASHVVLDLVGVNPGTRGVPLFWPISAEALGTPLGLFGHFRYGDIGNGISSVVRWTNVDPLLREIGILSALVLAIRQREWIWRTVRDLLTRPPRSA